MSPFGTFPVRRLMSAFGSEAESEETRHFGFLSRASCWLSRECEMEEKSIPPNPTELTGSKEAHPIERRDPPRQTANRDLPPATD
jgi:hypothetical protein